MTSFIYSVDFFAVFALLSDLPPLDEESDGLLADL